MNLRPSGYEPDELPGCSTPRRRVMGDVANGAAGRGPCLRFAVWGKGEARWGLFPFFAGLATTYSPVS